MIKFFIVYVGAPRYRNARLLQNHNGNCRSLDVITEVGIEYGNLLRYDPRLKLGEIFCYTFCELRWNICGLKTVIGRRIGFNLDT